MSLKDTEVEGKIVVILNSIIEKSFESYIEEIKQDSINTSLTFANRFISYNLKPSYGIVKTSSAVFQEDIDALVNNKNYQIRFNRLKSLLGDMYHFHIKHTFASLQEIKEYAQKEDATRYFVFSVDNLVEDYVKTIKIFKLNSFLAQRYTNYYHSENLYHIAGFIRNKRLKALLVGKGKGVNNYTFKALNLIVDEDLVTGVSYIKPNSTVEEYDEFDPPFTYEEEETQVISFRQDKQQHLS
ncbi:MAG: hypothetical protein AAF518_20565 [Spirochaetota bacterium]